MFKMTRQRSGDPLKAVKEATRMSNLEIGVRVAAQAKLFAPVDYGQLRNSISVATLKTSMLLNDGAGKQGERLSTEGLRGDEAYAGFNVQYGVHQEYGTRVAVAQPFLRPAKEMVINGATVGDIVTKFGREQMKKELEQRKQAERMK